VLWFRGFGTPGTPSDDLVEISPSTGAVLATVPDSVLPAGTETPAMVGNGAALWLAGSSGSSSVIETLNPGQPIPKRVYTATGTDAPEWLAAAGGHVWAYLRLQLIQFDGGGAQVAESAPQELGQTPVLGSAGALWTSGETSRCDSPFRIWEVKRAHAMATTAATVHTPYETCLATSGMVASGRVVFAFLADEGFASKLLLITPHRV
jgi:hypothetical protein